jgi:heptosyltransferase-1
MSSLGDVIHTLPALTDAAAACPELRFDWVVEEAFREVPGWHPAVERAIPVALRRWRKRPFSSFSGPEWRDFRRSLAAVHYDRVIDAQGLLKSAFVSRLARAPVYGFDRHSAREGVAALGYQHRIAVPRQMHAVERSRQLFARALDYHLPTGAGDYGVRAQMPATGGDHERSLLFFHGTARAEKLWPQDHWITLARLADEAGYRVWLPWGSDAEHRRAEAIAAAVESAQVLPRLDLLGLASLLLEVQGAVAVDTGLGHLAAALDVPAVSLYGPTQTALIGSYGGNQSHVVSPLADDPQAEPGAMMAAIEPAAVWQALASLLPVDPPR